MTFHAMFHGKITMIFNLKIGSEVFYHASKNEDGQYLMRKFVPMCQTLENWTEKLSVIEFYKISVTNKEHRKHEENASRDCKKYSSKIIKANKDGMEMASACEYQYKDHDNNGDISYTLLKRIEGSTYILLFNRKMSNLDVSNYNFENPEIQKYQEFIKNVQITKTNT